MNVILIAYIVDANNSLNILEDYPKTYKGDNALNNARSDFHAVASEMYKVGTRKKQAAVILSDDGAIIDNFCIIND